MAIAYDATSNTTEQLTVSSASFSHTCTGSNTVLAVGISARDTTLGNRTVSSVTYNGVALTKARSDDNGLSARSELWYLLNPTTGANTVVVTMGGTCAGIICGGVSLTGVRGASQPDASNGFTSGAATTATCNVTTVKDNSWVIDILRTTNTGTGYSVGGSQTQRWLVTGGSQLNAGMSTQGPKTPAGSTTDSWSWTTSVSAALTSVSFSPLQVSTLTAVFGTFTLTGIAVAFKRALKLILDVASYTLTGFVVIMKGTISWLNSSKTNSTWNNTPKN